MSITRIPTALPISIPPRQPLARQAVPTAIATPPAAPVHMDAVTVMAQAAQSLYEHIVRDVQNVVNGVNDYGVGVINGVIQFHQIVANPEVYAILLYLPLHLGTDVKWLANNFVFRFMERLSENPIYKGVTGVFMKIAPVLGLIAAPFDIRNCLQKWRDPKASMLDKVCTSICLVTGILMCAGGVLGFVLPWLGLPAGGALALSIAGKIGLVNLVASLPSIFDGVMGVFHWIGRQAKRVL